MNIKEKLGLNKEQCEAVTDINGPSMIIAGPGSGKTRCLIARTIYMINNGIKPENILLFTFTRKAANEIIERLEAELGNLSKNITVGTYHSIANKILRKYSSYSNLDSNYSIYDENDSKKILKEMFTEYSIDLKVTDVFSKIVYLKQKMLTPEQAALNSQNNFDNFISNIYYEYEQRLKKNNAVDFEDLILKAIKILDNNIEIREKVNSKYQYITVDEAHDSSIKDLTFIRLLTEKNRNLCMICDEDQSIYAFRGADTESVMNMLNIYSDMRVHILNNNYRSTQIIVNASKSLINNNAKLIKKNSISQNELGNKIILFKEKSSKGEAVRVYKLIKLCVEKYGYSYNDIAVLYRNNYLSKDIENLLFKYSVPYEISNGVNIYDRKEIKDIISFFTILMNPYDEMAFKRICEVVKKGIADTTIKEVIDYSYAHECICINGIELILEDKNYNSIRPSSKKGLLFLLNVLFEINETVNTISIADNINKIIELTGYLDDIDEEEADKRKEHINNLIGVSYNYDNLYDFLSNFISLYNRETIKDENKVKLLTMHNSKGLEFKIVIITDLIEEVIPSAKALTEKEIEEERRIFYVACTRAQKLLFFITPKYRMFRGKNLRTKTSRFIDEISEEYLFVKDNTEK